MTADEAYAILSGHCQFEVGKFYGHVEGLSLGTGLLYNDVRAPEFDQEQSVFMTVERQAYVLTHECDIDPANERAFNDHLLICPVIRVEDFVAEFEAEFSNRDALVGFLAAAARRQVSRVVFLPASPGLEQGGFLYLNALASTHVSVFSHQRPFAAVSAFGLQVIDYALQNHLLRQKAERLALGEYAH
ncbi:hypothetical protein JI739_18655 [Ramlibacter sp. AW1]|uniref:Uncharacterized protein n=1 Tax=Ramlibacter aurantiacus TaxID=2801330 RepID=A0A937D8S1_9BURK|nr:hypothetical protein [Ramlibacter aurantiacus]MBL0422376.1 hypothetical protein [Ramlibacter aurantiacus]